MLARRGHITPLAQDTLRERRVTVVREGSASAEEPALAPPADIRTRGHRQRPHRHHAAPRC